LFSPFQVVGFYLNSRVFTVAAEFKTAVRAGLFASARETRRRQIFFGVC